MRKVGVRLKLRLKYIERKLNYLSFIKELSGKLSFLFLLNPIKKIPKIKIPK